MKSLAHIKFGVLTLVFLPFVSFGQLSSEPQDEFTVPETKESVVSVKVSDIKKMTRYSLGFVIDLPTMSDVIDYMGNTLGLDIEEVDELSNPNWNPNTLSTRNFKVSKNEQGVYAVELRYYPPANPMEVENVSSIQRVSRVKCSDAFQQLKADSIN